MGQPVTAVIDVGKTNVKLLARGADVTVTQDNGMTAAQIAMRAARSERDGDADKVVAALTR